MMPASIRKWRCATYQEVSDLRCWTKPIPNSARKSKSSWPKRDVEGKKGVRASTKK
jgi:hypothetical protein